MSKYNAVDIMNNNLILSKAHPDNLKKYLSSDSVKFKSFSAGDEIYSPRSCERLVGILLYGCATVRPESEGENAILKLLRPEEMFGISNLYSQKQPFPSVITARCACEVMFIDAPAFASLIENDSGALRAYLSLLNNKIGYLNKKISTLTAGSTEKRLALYLAENQCDGEFSADLSMSALSDMLNVGRASLYRALDSLSAAGLILRDGKKILIPDKNALLNL